MLFKPLKFLLQHVSAKNTLADPYFHHDILYLIPHLLELELSLVWVGTKLALAFRSVSFQKFSFQEAFGRSACC